MNEFYKRMNIKNAGKKSIVEHILNSFNSEDTIVIDLGAGSCVIEQMLIEKKFKGSFLAIEQNKVKTIHNTSKHKLVRGDILEKFKENFFDIIEYKNIVIVMSAILHELNKDYLKRLSLYINAINWYDRNLTVIIREPLISDTLIKNDFEIIGSEEFELYKSYHKHNNWNEQIAFINFCFLKSYGQKSWEREKHEGRFTFTNKEINKFMKDCNCKMTFGFLEKDEFYKNTLPYNMYDNINYTSSLIIGGNKHGIK